MDLQTLIFEGGVDRDEIDALMEHGARTGWTATRNAYLNTSSAEVRQMILDAVLSSGTHEPVAELIDQFTDGAQIARWLDRQPNAGYAVPMMISRNPSLVAETFRHAKHTVRYQLMKDGAVRAMTCSEDAGMVADWLDSAYPAARLADDTGITEIGRELQQLAVSPSVAAALSRHTTRWLTVYKLLVFGETPDWEDFTSMLPGSSKQADPAQQHEFSVLASIGERFTASRPSGELDASLFFAVTRQAGLHHPAAGSSAAAPQPGDVVAQVAARAAAAILAGSDDPDLYELLRDPSPLSRLLTGRTDDEQVRCAELIVAALVDADITDDVARTLLGVAATRFTKLELLCGKLDAQLGAENAAAVITAAAAREGNLNLSVVEDLSDRTIELLLRTMPVSHPSYGLLITACDASRTLRTMLKAELGHLAEFHALAPGWQGSLAQLVGTIANLRAGH